MVEIDDKMDKLATTIQNEFGLPRSMSLQLALRKSMDTGIAYDYLLDAYNKEKKKRGE